MIIDPTYGPQLDSKDGTLGKLKLVKRWVIVYPDIEIARIKSEHPKELEWIDLDGPMGLSVWFGKSGGKILNTKAEAVQLIQSFYANNPPERVPQGLKPAQAWHYPNGGFACLCE